MSQHSERTQFGPSRASVAAGAVLVVASAVATGYMLAGLSLDLRDALGFALGVGFTGLLAYHVLVMVGERAVARDRAERAAERERREASQTHAELNAWQNATGALLDAYLSGYAVDFHGEPVPPYVLQRLADVPPVAPPTHPEPLVEPPYEPEDEGLVVYPSPSPDATRAWLRDPEAAVYAEPEPDPHGYVADPARPWSPATERAAAVLDRVVAEHTGGYPVAERTPRSWNAFEPASARRPELERVSVPLPPRDGYVDPGPYSSFVPVSPGRHDPDATEVITRPGSPADPDATEVIERVR